METRMDEMRPGGQDNNALARGILAQERREILFEEEAIATAEEGQIAAEGQSQKHQHFLPTEAE
jgi:hypothetical protein